MKIPSTQPAMLTKKFQFPLLVGIWKISLVNLIKWSTESIKHYSVNLHLETMLNLKCFSTLIPFISKKMKLLVDLQILRTAGYLLN